MNFRWYVALMGFGTALACIAWLFVVQTMNPDEAGITAFLFFYLTLFLALVGVLSLAGLVYRISFRRRHEMLSREVKVSFRHAILLSSGAIIALWLSANRHLAWYWLLALAIGVACVEYFFLILQAARRQ